MAIEDEVRAKFEMSTDELLIEIGHNVGMFEAPPSDKVAKSRGKQWFDERLDKFERIVCRPSVKKIANEQDSFALTVAVAQTIANALGDDFGTATVAILLARRGINRLCSWS